MMVRRVSWMHEWIFARPQEEDRRVGEEGRPQGRDRPPLRGRSRYGQALLQATRRARNARTQKGSRQSPETGREGQAVELRRPQREDEANPRPKSKVPVRGFG